MPAQSRRRGVATCGALCAVPCTPVAHATRTAAFDPSRTIVPARARTAIEVAAVPVRRTAESTGLRQGDSHHSGVVLTPGASLPLKLYSSRQRSFAGTK